MGKARRRALYPGSFDPVTYGHLDLIERAQDLFDEVHVAVAINADKSPLFTAEDRVEFIKRSLRAKKNVSVAAFSGLIVDHAKRLRAGTIIRGLRATSDFDYEFQMAMTNRRMVNEIDTIFLMPSESYFYLSSRLVKEISALGGKVSHFVPPLVERALLTRR